MNPQGPAVVALGGGHGLSITLRAARRYAASITAVVSVADDGGSSGRLRDALGIPAPGDLRKCLVALGDQSSVWARAFEHRFDAGELDGHAVGNIVLAGLIAATGDVERALEEAGALLGAEGRALPATIEPVTLTAEAAGGPVQGQVRIATAGSISRIGLEPADAAAPEAVLKAIASADQVIVGPGSLFTSVLAVVAVPDIRAALDTTDALKVYVGNLREQDPETSDYDIAAHVRALRDHGLEVDVVVADPDALPLGTFGIRVVEANLVDRQNGGHDPDRLGAVLAGLRR